MNYLIKSHCVHSFMHYFYLLFSSNRAVEIILDWWGNVFHFVCS